MTDSKYHRPVMIVKEWHRIEEFPSWEINADGDIRNRVTKVIKSTYTDQNNHRCVQISRDGKRYTRTILSILKKTWPSKYGPGVVKMT